MKILLLGGCFIDGGEGGYGSPRVGPVLFKASEIEVVIEGIHEDELNTRLMFPTGSARVKFQSFSPVSWFGAAFPAHERNLYLD